MGRRPESPEVPPDQMLEGYALVDAAHRHVIARQSVQVGPAPLPGTRRRHPDHVDPESHSFPDVLGESIVDEHLDQIRSVARPVGESLGDDGRDCLPTVVIQITASCHAAPQFPSGPAHRFGEDRVVRRREDVNRDSHDRRLNELCGLQRVGQLWSSKPPETRPEPDVGGRRVLSLDAADPLHGAGDGEAGLFEEQLAGKQGAVESAGGEDSSGHQRSG